MTTMLFLRNQYLGNSLLAYLAAAAAFLATVWGFLLGRRLLISRLRTLAERTATDLDDLAVDMLEKIKKPECYLIGFFIATRPLVFDARVDGVLRAVLMTTISYRIVTMFQLLLDYGLGKAMIDESSDPARRQLAKTLSMLLRGLVWIGAAVFVLANLGFNVTSMIAGLGVGGIAVALAAQAVLGDLFSAVAIFLDKPFVVGDFINLGDAAGTVEHIGIKTTRVRALSGEMLVVPNSQLTSSRIRNFKQMRERRIVFKFGLVYDTSEKLLAEAPEIVRSLIQQDKLMRFDRAHFMNFGDSSLDFEVVYFLLDADYNKFMDGHQRLLLDMVREFRAKGYRFAFPTRTLHIESEGK